MKNALKTISLFLVLLAGPAVAVTDTFIASGTWTAPAGVTSVDVEVWGGGGAGGGQNQNSDGGGGGGGGAYSSVIGIAVIPGNNYTVVVGAGGIGVTAGTGGTGEDSYFINTATVMAKGGSGGAPSTGTPPAGGAGGSAAAGVGTTKFSGGNGGRGINNNNGRGAPGGSSAGTAANGTNGPDPWATTTAAAAPAGGGIGGDGGGNGANGLAPASGDGGGGGGSGEGTNRVGGNGAAGKVVLNYVIVPAATTNAATAITTSTATLNGTVSSNGASTTVIFDYGLTAAYGSTATAAQSPLAAGATNSAVSAALNGLTCGTTYHFMVTATNSAGTTNGSDLTFATSVCPLPIVTTNPATGVGTTSATLNGTVNDNGYDTIATFEYGTTVAYGSSITAGQSPILAGTGNTAVTSTLFGLSCNTTYHFRVKGVNANGTSNGIDRTFATVCAAPTVTTAAASSLTTTGATLNGTVNDNGASTTVTFDYGPTVAYGSTITATQSPVGPDWGSTLVSANVSGMSCNTTYHYRARGVSAIGTTNGGDQLFTTAACPTGVPVTSSPTACVNDNGTGTVNWGTLTGPLLSENLSATALVDGQTSRYLKCTGYGFAIPAGATINGIVVNVERRSSSTANGGSRDNRMRLVKADVIQATDRATATIYTTADATEAHGGAADMWGTTWAVAEINAATFGAAFSATKPSNNGAAHTISVDHMPITVYYTPTTPWVASINRVSSNPTVANTSVSWDVLFSGNATGVDITDFELILGGSATGATITGVTGSGRVWTVTANTGTGATGTLGLNLADNDTITIGGVPLGGAGDNADFTGEVYTIEIPVCTGSMIYCDDFERANYGAVGNGWTITPGGGADCAGVAGNSGCAGIDTDIPPFNATTNRANTTRSMFTRWSIVTVESRPIDLSGYPSALLSFWMRRGGDTFSEYPEAVGEDYLVKYLASDNTWKVLAQYPTGVQQGQVFTPVIQLPTDAMHANFKLQFYQPAGSGDANGGATGGAAGVVGYDYWHFDNVIITDAPESSYTGAFCDNFEAGLGRWSISAEGAPPTAAIGDAALNTTDFLSATHELDMRWGYVSVSTLRTDMTGVSGDIVYWVKSGTSAARDPDVNEDLVVEYRNSSGIWTNLATYPGTAAAGTIYNATHVLPNDAKHTGFRLRFRQLNGSAYDNDYWHVDDVCVGTPPADADLSLAKTRSGPLVPGSNASYTLAVTNNGPDDLAGTIEVVDTLPAGLDFSSASGTGWVCTWNVPDVTCGYVGTVVNGATTPPITLTVAVDPNATGTITNTATVTSTGIDANTLNNTDTDSFTIFVSSILAEFHLEEAAWNGTAGEVKDTAGYPSGPFNGTAIGSPDPSPAIASPAQSGSPGTCGYSTMPGPVANGGAFSISGLPVSTDVDDSASVAFWMYWDGTNNVMPIGWNRHDLWLQGGFFGFNTANTDIYGVSSVGLANGWHHVVAVFTNGSVTANQLYIDGVSQALGQVMGTPNLANATVGPTLRVGGWTQDTGYRFSGRIDEVLVYQGALTQSEVTAVYTATHTCIPTVDHYELSLPSDSIACLASTATVTACADTSNPCTNPVTTIAGQTATLSTTAGTLGTSSVVFGATGVASTTLSHPTVADDTDVTVTLSGETLAAANLRKCCPDGANCVDADSCTTNFKTAGFIFSSAAGAAATTIPTQEAGTSSGTYFLRAVKTNTATQACEAGLTGTNVPVEFAYECINPTTCYGSNLMSINGGSATTIARNDSGSVSSYTPVNMNFDSYGNGNAPFTLNYSDVGLVALHARKTLTAAFPILAVTLSGTSNAFVVKPAGFELSAIEQTALPNLANPAAASAAGARFVRAGEDFSATVTAVTSTGTTAFNYGRETIPEGVLLTSALVGGLGLTNDPGVTNGTAFGTFSDGEATGTTFRWNEVGIITLTPYVGDGDYLGAGNVTGTTTGNVGRFYAAQFGMSANSIVNRADECPAAAACPSAFTYMGEQMNAEFTLTAQAVDGTRLQNYVDTFAKLDPTSAALNLGVINDPAGTRVPLATARISTAGLPAETGQFLSTCLPTPACLGTANVVAPFMITRLAAGDGPYTLLTVGVAPVDSDGAILIYDLDTVNVVAGANNHATVGVTDMRYGRIKVSNAYGSELLPLTVQATAQYFTANGWVNSSNDSITNLTPAGPYTVGTGNTAVTLSPASGDLVSGIIRINLGIPSAGAGVATVNPGSPAYLPVTTGTATFGVYKNRNNYIYRREN